MLHFSWSIEAEMEVCPLYHYNYREKYDPVWCLWQVESLVSYLYAITCERMMHYSEYSKIEVVTDIALHFMYRCGICEKGNS